MALLDILSSDGDSRALVLELPTASYSGALADIMAIDNVDHPGGILEMDAWDALIEGTVTAREALRTVLDTAVGNTEGFPGSPKIKNIAGTKNRVEASLDIQGNRTRTALDVSE